MNLASNPPDNDRWVLLHYSDEYIASNLSYTFPLEFSKTIVGCYKKGIWMDDMQDDVLIPPSHWMELNIK